MTQRTFDPLCQANNLWVGENEFNGNSIIKATTRLALPSGAPANNGDVSLDSATLKYKAGGVVYSAASGLARVPVPAICYNNNDGYIYDYFPILHELVGVGDPYVRMLFPVPRDATATMPVFHYGILGNPANAGGDIELKIEGRAATNGGAITAAAAHSSTGIIHTVATGELLQSFDTWNGDFAGATDFLIGVKFTRYTTGAGDTHPYTDYLVGAFMEFEVSV